MDALTTGIGFLLVAGLLVISVYSIIANVQTITEGCSLVRGNCKGFKQKAFDVYLTILVIISHLAFTLTTLFAVMS